MSNIVLGIDPGSRFLGYGLFSWDTSTPRYLTHQSIAVPPHLVFAERLHYIQLKLNEVYLQYQPVQTVVERAFFGKNAESAFKLGMVRGVCLSLAAQYKNAVHEYAPRTVKKVVSGYGDASKEQVALILANELRIQLNRDFDATDALALAWCHIVKQQTEMRLRQAEL